MDSLRELLSAEVSSTQLSLFRIFFGLLLLGSHIHKRNFLLDYYTSFDFYFKYPLFSWVKPFGKLAMRGIIYLLILSLFTFSIGLFYHLSAFVALILYTYIFLLDKARYNNHFYLIILLLFLFNVVNGDSRFAVDHYLFSGDSGSITVPYWQLLIFQLQFLIVYTYGGISKITRDWLIRGEPMNLLFQSFTPKIEWNWRIHRYCYNEEIANRVTVWLKKKYSGFLFAWLGMVFDLLIIWLLIIPACLPFALPIFISFHLFNLWFFKIGIFPYLNFAAIVLFIRGGL